MLLVAESVENPYGIRFGFGLLDDFLIMHYDGIRADDNSGRDFKPDIFRLAFGQNGHMFLGRHQGVDQLIHRTGHAFKLQAELAKQILAPG
jgi:hypothetical protein